MNDYILYGKQLNKEHYLNNGEFFKIKELSIIKLDKFANNGLKIKKLEENGFKQLNLKIFLKDKLSDKYQDIIKRTKDFEVDFHQPLDSNSIILIENDSDIKASNKERIKKANILNCFFTEYNQFLDLINKMEINKIDYIRDENWKKSIDLINKEKIKKNSKKINENLKSEINLDLDEEFTFL